MEDEPEYIYAFIDSNSVILKGMESLLKRIFCSDFVLS
jgi:hypothetical protein